MSTTVSSFRVLECTACLRSEALWVSLGGQELLRILRISCGLAELRYSCAKETKESCGSAQQKSGPPQYSTVQCMFCPGTGKTLGEPGHTYGPSLLTIARLSQRPSFSRTRLYHISRRTRHELQAHHGHVALLNRLLRDPPWRVKLLCECECVSVCDF